MPWSPFGRRRDDGEHQVRNLQLLCPYCNRVKGTAGSHGYRLKMEELRAHNVRTGVMVDQQLAVLTAKRLAQYHRDGSSPRSSRTAA